MPYSTVPAWWNPKPREPKPNYKPAVPRSKTDFKYDPFRKHFGARTPEAREAAFESWWSSHQRYREAVLAKAKSESKQYKAALRSKDEVRELWMRRYRKPINPWRD